MYLVSYSSSTFLIVQMSYCSWNMSKIKQGIKELCSRSSIEALNNKVRFYYIYYKFTYNCVLFCNNYNNKVTIFHCESYLNFNKIFVLKKYYAHTHRVHTHTTNIICECCQASANISSLKGRTLKIFSKNSYFVTVKYCSNEILLAMGFLKTIATFI